MKEQVETLRKEIAALAAAVRRDDPLLNAYLYQTHMRCGKSGCRCMNSDYRHSLWCLSYVADGKSHTRTVPDEAVPEIRAMCEHYRRLRGGRKQLLSLAEQVAAAVDEHVEQRAEQGWERFEQIKAPDRKIATKTATGSRRQTKKQ